MSKSAMRRTHDNNRPAKEKPNKQASLFSPQLWATVGEHLEMTPRELEIARLLCDGETYESAAIKLGISTNTVRSHVRTLFQKLSVNDGIALVLRLETAARSLGQSSGPGS